jgi:hypothetical protein
MVNFDITHLQVHTCLNLQVLPIAPHPLLKLLHSTRYTATAEFGEQIHNEIP